MNKKLIKNTGIVILLAISGMTGEFYLNPDITLLDQKYTGYEYTQIRNEMAEWGDKYDGTEPPNEAWEKHKLYVEVLDIEIKKNNNKIHPFSDAKKILKDYEVKGKIK